MSQTVDPHTESEIKTTKRRDKRTIETESEGKIGFLMERMKKRKQKIMKIGTWNVQTLLRPGKMNEVANEVMRYGVEVAAIQEMRWKGEGEIKKKKYTLLYSGEKNQGKNGIGFIVTSKIDGNIMTFKPINGRIAYLRIRAKTNMSLVNCYAPTEDSNDNEKEAFYNELESLCDTIPKRDMLIILGDFNAKIGKEERIRNIAGKNTIHDRTNTNGDRLSNLAEATNSLIVSTKFEHKKMHKITWRWPGGGVGEGNQIDHILTSKRNENMVTDVRSFRGANADTDHYLVIAKIKQGTTKHSVSSTSKKKLDIEELKNLETRRQYIERLDRELNQKEIEVNIDKEFENIADGILESAKEVVGYKKMKKSKEWYDEECAAINKQKREDRLQWLKTGEHSDLDIYKERTRKANRLFKQKKNQWYMEKMEEIEKNNKFNNTRLFYQLLRRQNPTHKVKTRGMKSDEGVIENSPEKVKQIWKKHFQKLLNVEQEQVTESGTHAELISDEQEIPIPSTEEIMALILKMKNNKAPGGDDINAELIKYGGSEVCERLCRLVQQVWKEEVMPNRWREGVIIPLKKKGDASECRNYRGITLLSSAYKILSTLIYRRLREYTKTTVGDYQMGFTEGKSTIDAIHIVKRTMEKMYEHDMELSMLFVDFQQAFDMINREELYKAMEEMNIPTKMINLTKMTMERTVAYIRTEEGETEVFEINSGVRQGDALSAMLFNIVIEKIVKELDAKGSITTKEGQILAYADDIVIMARTRRRMEEIFKELRKKAKKMGLLVNQSKTKYMRCSKDDRQNHGVTIIDELTIEEVDSFIYLGVIINRKCEREEEIKKRVQAGNRAFYHNKSLLKDKKLSRETKIKIYKTLIRPVVAYAAETACYSKREAEILKTFERKIMRTIIGMKKCENGIARPLMNFEIEEEIKGENIVRHMKAQRIRWVGHIMRKNDNDIVKKITMWRPSEDRGRGRPKIRWWDQVTDDLRAMGEKDWMRKTQSRQIWKDVARSAATHEDL